MQARREAQQADIVVVNHHLFFADIMLRDTGMAELLPTANTVIFDEAHQLPETATLFFGETLSTTQFLELARDSRGRRSGPCARNGRLGEAWRGARTRGARRAAGVQGRFGAPVDRPAADDHPLFPALETLETELDALASALAGQAERAESIGACLRRARELQGVLARLDHAAHRDRARSRRGQAARLTARPSAPIRTKRCAGSKCSRIPCSCTKRRCRSRRSSRSSAPACRARGSSRRRRCRCAATSRITPRRWA